MKNKGVDSKESWIVCLGVAIVFLIVALPMRLGSQLYVSMLDHFEADRKSVSFTFALVYLLRSVSGPFAGYFSNKFGLRTVCFLGCIFSIFGVGGCYFANNILAVHIMYGLFYGPFAGYFSNKFDLLSVCLCGCILNFIGIGGCYFAKDIITVYILFGLFYGTGFGLATNIAPVIINQHFKKHRSKAIGFVFGMSGLATFISSPILEMILNEYGVSGSFLIISGIILNSILSVQFLAMLRPNNITKTNIKNGSSLSEDLENKKNLSAEANLPYIGDKSKGKIFDFPRSSSLSGQEISILNHDNNKHDSRIFIEKYHMDNLDNDENTSDFKKSSNAFQKSAAFINCAVTPNNQLKDFSEFHLQERKTSPKLFKRRNLNYNLSYFNKNTCSKSSSLSILWSPIFLFVAFITSSHFYVMYLFFTITVDVARDKGIENYQEAYFVMVLSLFDTIGRSSLGILTDSGILSQTNYCALCFVIMGLLCIAIALLKGFFLNIIAFSLLGLIIGGNATGLPGIVTQLISNENRVMAMSSRMILYAPMSFTVAPLIGYFRDYMGTYNWLLYMQTLLCLFCSGLLLLLPHANQINNNFD